MKQQQTPLGKLEFLFVKDANIDTVADIGIIIVQRYLIFHWILKKGKHTGP